MPRGCPSVLWVAAVLAAASVWFAPRAGIAAQPPADCGVPEDSGRKRPDPKKVALVRVKGDLDNLRLVKDFAAAIAEVERDGAGLCIVELEANAWRADVVWAMAEAMRSSRSRCVGYLNDPDDRVGVGALLLAMCGASCYAQEKTLIAAEAADNLRSDAPSETDWEAVDRQLQGAVWTSLKRRSADSQLVETLLAPTGQLWASADAAGTPARLLAEPPKDVAGAPAATQILAASPLGEASRLRLGAELAESLGVVTASVRSAGEFAALEGGSAGSATRRAVTVVSGLAKARADLGATMERIDRALSLSERVLADVPRRSRPDSVRKSNEAGRESLSLLKETRTALQLCEGMFSEYPELYRETVPGVTPVGQEDRKPQWLWRQAFQTRRDRLDELEADARLAAERKER
ncbi:MAG: hypothetical protein H7Y88_07855 [Phycisphaerales bacterium]|nr:hypothetical protein [Phycisphaerales bacterium]